jgi:hypothetical protein
MEVDPSQTNWWAHGERAPRAHHCLGPQYRARRKGDFRRCRRDVNSSFALSRLDLTDNDRSVRAPTAELPNVAAFLGGMVAQEAIKMITRQYIPVNGYCVVDLVDTWTGVLFHQNV